MRARRPNPLPYVTDARALLAAAIAARRGAYAPYSGFSVGAALLGRDGRIWTGANVENAVYGLSLCAERNAIATAVAAGGRSFEAIAIAGPDGTTTLPCGACRQVMWEFAQQLRIVYLEQGGVKTTSIQALFPEPFGATQLHEAHGR
jgi:cytidine deaminase